VRKSLAALALLPLLVACEEIGVPFVAPLTIPVAEVNEGADGLYHLHSVSDELSLDDLRAELPAGFQGVRDFTVTNLTLSDPGTQVRDPEYDEVRDPEYDEVRDPEYDEVRDPEYDEVRDPEYDELSNFVVSATIYVSADDQLDPGDQLLAFIDEFSEDQAHYEAEVTENAQLSYYEDEGFHLIVTSVFTEQPPEHLDLPLMLAGYGSMQPSEMLQVR